MVTTTEEILLKELKDDVFHLIFSFVPVKQLLGSVVNVCHVFRDACDSDPRFLPLIAPPALADQVLDVAIHGKDLRLHYRRYLNWLKVEHKNEDPDWSDEDDEDEDEDEDEEEDWSEDDEESSERSQVKRGREDRDTPLDGFFSLAPWTRVTGLAVKPTPWLHRMAYEKNCPSEIARTKKTKPIATNYYKGITRSSRRLRNTSLFFRQRERGPTQDVFRHFSTSPIYPEDGSNKNSIKKVIVQPVNFRDLDGNRIERIPDVRADVLFEPNETCKKILQCYFGVDNAIVSPTIEHCINPHRNCRDDLQELIDEEKKPIRQIASEALEGLARLKEENEESVTIFVIAPHMYHRQSPWLAWCFSSPLSRFPWWKSCVISTFQFHQYYQDLAKLRCRFVRLSLYACLVQFPSMNVCENKYCAMNNSDSMDELEDACHVTMCPLCIRKLHLSGFIPNPLNLMEDLVRVLQQHPFSRYNQGDLNKFLKNYAFGSKAPKSKDTKKQKLLKRSQ